MHGCLQVAAAESGAEVALHEDIERKEIELAEAKQQIDEMQQNADIDKAILDARLRRMCITVVPHVLSAPWLICRE